MPRIAIMRYNAAAPPFSAQARFFSAAGKHAQLARLAPRHCNTTFPCQIEPPCSYAMCVLINRGRNSLARIDLFNGRPSYDSAARECSLSLSLSLSRDSKIVASLCPPLSKSHTVPPADTRSAGVVSYYGLTFLLCASAGFFRILYSLGRKVGGEREASQCHLKTNSCQIKEWISSACEIVLKLTLLSRELIRFELFMINVYQVLQALLLLLLIKIL